MLVVDGGGSTTRAALCLDGGPVPVGEAYGLSANPHSVGRAAASANLLELVERVWRDRPPGVHNLDSVWLCLSTASSAAAVHDLVARLPDTGPLAGTVWVANDVLPLLVHDGRVADRVVVNCGTGTGFCGVNASRACSAQASGREYLLADEGGGFDLGMQGLRAVVRADDGRGPPTAMTAMLAAWRGVGVDGLVDVVHAEGREPKAVVASFAPFVLAAAAAGDERAGAVVAVAAQELLDGVGAVARRTRIDGTFEVVLAGSNLVAGQPVLRDRFTERLAREWPRATVHEATGSTLAPVARMARLVECDAAAHALLAGCLPLARFAPRRVKPGHWPHVL